MSLPLTPAVAASTHPVVLQLHDELVAGVPTAILHAKPAVPPALVDGGAWLRWRKDARSYAGPNHVTFEQFSAVSGPCRGRGWCLHTHTCVCVCCTRQFIEVCNMCMPDTLFSCHHPCPSHRVSADPAVVCCCCHTQEEASKAPSKTGGASAAVPSKASSAPRLTASQRPANVRRV